MTLGAVIRDLESLDPAATIYAAEPWAEASQAVVVREPEEGGLPTEARMLGLRYFLEVGIARDFLEGWVAGLGARPNLHQTCARLIRYARHDA